MNVSVIIGLVIWIVFCLAGVIGEIFFSIKKPEKIITKAIILFGGFLLGSFIFCLLGVLGYVILSPILVFFDLPWFIHIGF